MYVQFVDRSRLLRGAFCLGPYHPGAVEGWVVGLYRSCAVEGWVVGLYRSCAGLYCAFRPPLNLWSQTWVSSSMGNGQIRVIFLNKSCFIIVFNICFDISEVMDSSVSVDGYFVDLIDDKWRSDKLPQDDITVPTYELADPEADSGDIHLTLKEQEQKWTDIALSALSEHQ
ncbi:hypothetical protein Zmor_011028 [Zophobas morio]|uniref:Anaphase-promoting complex subunit 13 n=1 Tax=Zophobas morio TaxID=2755281 RepID=A0AA38IJX7_9CUCU|nr:hypothetical protein Zmor_011028 [Zophobas morio]